MSYEQFRCTCARAGMMVSSPAAHIDTGYIPGGPKIWTPGCPVCLPPGEDDHYAFETPAPRPDGQGCERALVEVERS